MTTQKPTVVLIPGSYCPALFYNDLKHLLIQAGYDVELHDLPTTSRAPGLTPASLSDDGKYFHAIVENLANKGKESVVVAHSYGGVVLRESIHNLSKRHRQKQNQAGGIIKLIYISPLLLDKDETGIQSFARYAELLTFPSANFTEPVDTESEGGLQYLRQNPVKGWKFFFGDMGMEEGVKWMARMTMHTMAAWTTPATELPEDERRVPVTFVKCLQDVVFPIAFQEEMLKLLEKEGSAVDVREIDTAHCPNASCPDKLAEILVKAVEDGKMGNKCFLAAFVQPGAIVIWPVKPPEPTLSVPQLRKLKMLMLIAAQAPADNSQNSSASSVDYSQYVNVFIGAEGPMPGQAFGGGDIFVGGAVPFGVAKVGLDTYESNLTLATLNGGYTPEGLVTGVTMMHESGTGGEPKYGIVHQMPLTTISPPVNILDNTTYWQKRVGNDTGRVGYFSTNLENGVRVSLSAARHSGIMQYDFPAGESHVLVDVSHYLPAYGQHSSQTFLGGEITAQPGSSMYTGYGTWGSGWGECAPMRVFFCGEFSQMPTQAQTWSARNTDPYQRQHVFSNEPYGMPVFGNGTEQSGYLLDRVGAVFSWANSSTPTTITSKVGISFISTQKACNFKDTEVPSWSLNDTVQAAVQEWNSDVFSKVQVPLGSSENQTNLVLMYSSLYFMHLMPSDRTGENPLWVSDAPSWDDFYTAWDIFRNTVSLYHLLQPDYYEGMIRALIDIWKYEGYMPDGRSGNYNGLVQGGSNADNILADAYVKGLRGSINWTEGWQAMLKDAEVLPYNTFSVLDQTGSVKEGRSALNDWIPLGYLSSDRSARSLSKSVEYSLNDFALYQVAQGESPGDAQKYLNRSAQWQNNWSHDAKSVNTTPLFTGFLTPRFSNGTFNVSGYNPALCGECEWSAISYEATPFEYSFVVPHDVETLIDFMGGSDQFEARLDYIFKPNTSQQNLGANGAGINTIMNIGNEPDFATPYLYNYLNKQYKSVYQSRALAIQYYSIAKNGVPGNSDAGAINSWLIWQMLGIYPIVTQTVYLIGSPWFSDLNMTINNNATLRILAHNLDNANSYYVQSVRLNGQNWTRNWFNHADIMVMGGTIEFFLGSNQTTWETGDAPPSPGHGGKPNANGTYPSPM